MSKCVNVVGYNHYLGKGVFKLGRTYRLVAEPNNKHDNEAVRVEMLNIDREYVMVGYVANSVKTRVLGCSSAGNIFDAVAEEGCAYGEVKFIKDDIIIIEL